MKNHRFLAILFMTILIISTIGITTSLASRKIIVSGASIGSTTNLAASAIADIAQNCCGILPTVVVNPTTAQVDVLQHREADISTTTGYLTFDAYHGLGNYDGNPFKEIRSLMQRPSTQMHIVVLKESSIKEIKDLVGKRLAFGKPGSASDVFGKDMLGAIGIIDDLGSIMNLSAGDIQAKLLTNQIDVTILAGTSPYSTITEISLSSRNGIRMIGLTKEEIASVIEKVPYFMPNKIPAVYKGMEENVSTVGYSNIYSCVDLSEEEAYCLTKNFWEHLDTVELYWSLLGELTLEEVSLIKHIAPWHIGAYRYYQEVGLDIPPEMIPPEAK
jgi:hypothetical protein